MLAFGARRRSNSITEPEPMRWTVIGETVSHYRILEKIGGGGMGVVYQAEDIRLGRVVALKFLHAGLTSNEANRKRFLREAQAASLIDHPNVCHVYQVEESDDGRLFIAMAYYGGRSLRAAIEAGPLPPRHAFEIAFSVAQGLWAAHRRGIVHRDIKPGNIVLSDDGFVKIVDFGLALLAGQSRVTTGDARVGTVAYMSPEQASSSSVDERTDIWSLGVVMYEMMTGRLPFQGDVDAALLYSIRSEPHTPLVEANRDVPEACARVVERCLAKRPEDRYESVEALLADMVAAANECGWSDTVASRTIAPILAAKKRRAWRRRAVAAAALALVATAGWWLWSRRAPPSPYVTELRIAVMPFENHLGAAHDEFVDGLGEHAAVLLDAMRGQRGSMWVVGYGTVVRASLPGVEAAAGAFGTNRVLTGDVQRFGSGQRISLALRETGHNRVLREATIDLSAASNNLLVDLPVTLSRLIGLQQASQLQAFDSDSPIANPYLEGLSCLRRFSSVEELQRAIAKLDSCSTLDPLFAPGVRAAGAAYLAEFRLSQDVEGLDRARKNARSALALAPRYVDAAILLGDVHAAEESAESSLTAFKTANLIDRGNFTAAERLANAYVVESRLSEAETVLRGLIDAKPDYWAGYRSLGRFYFEQGRREEAAAQWQIALTLAPRDVMTLNNLGATYYMASEWQQARQYFLEAYRIRPDCEPCNNVATVLFKEGDYAEAARYFEFALEYCDTNDYLAWGNWASALYWADGTRGRSRDVYRRAIRKAEQQLAGAPNDDTVIASLVDYYCMTDQDSLTRGMIARSAPFLDKDERVMYRVGSAYEKLGDREAALHHLGNAVRHGYPLALIESDPLLAQLVEDPRFQEMVQSESAADGAAAVENSR